MAHRDSPIVTRKTGRDSQQNKGQEQESSFESFMVLSFNELKQDIKAVQNSQTEITSRLDKIEQSYKLTGEKLVSLYDKATNIAETCDFVAEKLSALEVKVKQLEDNDSRMQAKLNELEGQISTYKEELNKLERFSRRNNLRMIGIKEEVAENPSEIVKNILSEKFELHDVHVERAHRVGKPASASKSRQIIFKLHRYTDKTAIMKTAKRRLEGTSLRIIDDLTKQDLDKKIRLRPIMNNAFKEGKKIRFIDGRLYIDGTLHRETTQ